MVYSVNIVGFGLPSAVLKTADSLRCCGSAQYTCAAYVKLAGNATYPVEMTIIDETGTQRVETGSFAMLQAQLTIHMGEKMPFCPRAKLDDGLFDVCAINRTYHTLCRGPPGGWTKSSWGTDKQRGEEGLRLQSNPFSSHPRLG